MVSGAKYRVASVTGTLAATVLALLTANVPLVQRVVTSSVPLTSRLFPHVLSGTNLTVSILTTVLIVGGAMIPLYRPRPRRILNILYQTQQRLLMAGFVLAAIGYFDYTYRLPRSTLIVTIGTLLGVLPVWFLAIRRAPSSAEDRVVIVGDDPHEIRRVRDALDGSVLGVVAPPSSHVAEPAPESRIPATDGSGGTGVAGDLELLGGLSRLEEVLVENDIGTAVFAFSDTDRQEFFGALGVCHDHGVEARMHREQADSVLVGGDPGSEIVDIQVEPWDWQDRIVKRAFDVAFAATSLLLLAPLIVAIAATIKLNDGGSVLYRQERTAEMGDTFEVYKFRSMVPDSEAVAPGDDADRITRIGRVLRRTHLDEIPQLWSILIGDMSVVGPRAAWVDEENIIEEEVDMWRQRWFVKPGLTGLAQINGVTSSQPEAKLRYDLEYIRRQTFRYDIAIVVRQLWSIFLDLLERDAGREDEG